MCWLEMFTRMIQAKIVSRHIWRHHLHLGADVDGDDDIENDNDDIENDDDDIENDNDDDVIETDIDDDNDFYKVFHPLSLPVWTCHSTRTRQKKTKKREREQIKVPISTTSKRKGERADQRRLKRKKEDQSSNLNNLPTTTPLLSILC